VKIRILSLILFLAATFAFSQDYTVTFDGEKELPRSKNISAASLPPVQLPGGEFHPGLSPASVGEINTSLYLVSLLRPLDNELEAQLISAEIELLQTNEGVHYWARSEPGSPPKTGGSFILSSPPHILKIDTRLQWIINPGTKKIVEISLLYADERERDVLQEYLNSLKAGNFVLETELPVMSCEIPADQILTIARLPEVLEIEWNGYEAAITNNRSSNLTKSTRARNKHNLTGKDVDVGVWDGDIAYYPHKEFDKRASYKGKMSEYYGSHATHVAGTIAASGKRGAARGIAPAANIVTYGALYGLNKNPVGDMIKAFRKKWVDLVNNSWGNLSGWSGYLVDFADFGYPGFEYHVWWGNNFAKYISDCRVLDNGVRNNDAIIVFSAGNDRNDEFPGGEYYNAITDTVETGRKSKDGPYGIIIPPGTAKNVITVGATNGKKAMSTFSNWGPGSKDGRLKPEISAPGVDLLSALPGNKYGKMSGTSMAAPVVSGAIALMVEQWKSLFGNNPSPQVIRCILAATANDIDSLGPDYRYGFGTLNTERATDLIKLQSEGSYIQEYAVKRNTYHSFTYNLTSSYSRLRFVLAWIDPPGASQVNNLDLTVLDVNGNTYYPFKLNPGNPSKNATYGINNVDNIEVLLLNNVPAGTVLTVRVSATKLGKGATQEYALTAVAY